MLIPLGVAVWQRESMRWARPCLIASFVALMTFLASSPFVLLDFKAFIVGIGFEGNHAAGGHLGSVGRSAFGFEMISLMNNLGVVGALMLIGSLIGAITGRLGGKFLVAWATFAVFASRVAFGRIEADRYLVPVLAVAAILVGATCPMVGQVLQERFGRVAFGVFATLLLLPVAWVGARAGMSGRVS